MNKLKKISTYVLLIIISCIHFIPFYILIGMAFKSQMDLSSRWVLPGYMDFNNIEIAVEKGKILLALLNSSIITFSGIIIVTIIGAMSAYPLARFRNKFNNKILSFTLAIMIVPPLSILVPLYKLVVALNSTSKLYSVIIVAATFALPISIFLYTNFLDTIPKSIDEAALIDGCNKFSIFYKILLPLLKPVTVTIIILTGRTFWNDYQFSLYFLQRPNVRTLTLSVASFFGDSQSNLNAAAASALMASIPIIILFIFLQKYFIQGVTEGSVK